MSKSTNENRTETWNHEPLHVRVQISVSSGYRNDELFNKCGISFPFLSLFRLTLVIKIGSFYAYFSVTLQLGYYMREQKGT